MGKKEKPDIHFVPPPNRGQLELPIAREVTDDRNANLGGRSFYFFDLDDNVLFLSTPTFLFHKETGKEVEISSAEYAKIQKQIGQTGPYRDYRVDFCNRTGSFRRFRDQDHSLIKKMLGKRQGFIEDLARALGYPDFHWKGPSWSCFYHAVLNQRPLSLITARGHHPSTLSEGMRLLVKEKYLPQEPNYLSLFPVSHPEIRRSLGDVQLEKSVPELKRAAIRESVEKAIEIYGMNPHHRFGMSDDDPHNIDLIVTEMKALKRKHEEMSFFVIETQGGNLVKWEVYSDHVEATLCAKVQEISIFEQLPLFKQE